MKRGGFSLIEVLVYTALIGVAGVFVNGALVNVLKLQNKQNSSTEVDRQVNFVLQLVQKGVRDSSLIEMPDNTATTTLRLRTKDPANDPTLIYLSGATVYMKIGAAAPLAITTADINADQLQFTKVSSYPGHDSVSVDISFSFNTENPQKEFTKTISSAVTRVSAATFDSDIIPGTDATYNVGLGGSRWLDFNLSRNLTVGGTGTFAGNVGIGTLSPSYLLDIQTNGNNYINLVSSTGSGQSTGIKFQRGTTSDNYTDFTIYDKDGGKLVIDRLENGVTTSDFTIHDGRIGIDQTSPEAKLHIDSSRNALTDVGSTTRYHTYIRNTSANTGEGVGLGFGVTSTSNIGAAIIHKRTGSSSQGELQFYTKNSTSEAADPLQRMVIDNAGKVGIGTTTPAQPLSVNGIIFSGTGGFKFPDGTVQTTAGGSAAVPTRQILTSGTSATYTTPANVRQLRIRMTGGGGGGGGFNASSGNATSGGTGGTTSFGSVTAVGGSGGGSNTTDQGRGGAGGTGGAGAASFRMSGNGGTKRSQTGGSGAFGGGVGIAGTGTASTVQNAAPNSGSGGSGGAWDGNDNNTGGGGAGEYVEIIINNPSATYTYTIGAGGTGGSQGTIGTSSPGGTGGSGVIFVEEIY